MLQLFLTLDLKVSQHKSDILTTFIEEWYLSFIIAV